jgi:hypothetical protein
MTVSPSPEQLSELIERARKLRDDCQVGVEVRRVMPNYCDACVKLKALAPKLLDALESAQAEIARLTTVSGDMVEEMARAICSKRIGPLEEGSWAILSERGKEAIREEAQAAATIAKGRIAELEKQRLMILAAVYGEAPKFVATICDEKLDRTGVLLGQVRDLARAALKDSPNVG